MLPKYIRDDFKVRASSIWLMLGLVLFVVPAYAQILPSDLNDQVNSLSPQTILANIQKTIPNLMRLVTAFAYVIGFMMVILGVMQLKRVGEMRTQMSHEHHLSGPILQITMGVLLIYLP